MSGSLLGHLQPGKQNPSEDREKVSLKIASRPSTSSEEEPQLSRSGKSLFDKLDEFRARLFGTANSPYADKTPISFDDYISGKYGAKSYSGET